MKQAVLHRVLPACVVIAAILTAFCPLYAVMFLFRVYLSLGQPGIAAISLAKGALTYLTAYVGAVVVYWLQPRLQVLLTVLAVIAAAYAIAQAPTYWSLVHERNLFHNMLAEPMWEMFGRCAIAVFALAHLVVGRAFRKPAHK